MLDLTALTTAVSNEQSVEASAITLLSGLTTELNTLIANSGNTVDPAALQAIVTQITTNATTLAAAVTANTPTATSSALVQKS